MNESWWFAQTAHRVRLDWGRRGAKSAADQGDILVVVDALSFSTTVAIAVARGAIVFPCAKGEDTLEFAAMCRAEIAVHRDKVPHDGRFSLSPITVNGVTEGTRIVLASPNGATCARYASHVPFLFAGAFVNATTVARSINDLLSASKDTAVTLLACGERWQDDHEDGDLRFAIEDYLAAGAIISGLDTSISRSPEAQAAENAWLPESNRLLATLSTAGSGIELIERGYPDDVRIAADLDSVESVPVLRNGAFMALHIPPVP